MLQAFIYFIFLYATLSEAISEDQSRLRLLRQEAENQRSSGWRGVEVQGTGAIAPLVSSRGVSEIQLHDVNATVDEGLSEVALAARSGFDVPECRRILQKVRSLLAAQQNQVLNEGLSVTQRFHLPVVNDSLTKLEDGNATEESLDLIVAALGNLTLKSALQTGSVWTASDQSQFFYSCFPGLTPVKELEEHNFFGDIETRPYEDPTVSLSNDSREELHEVRYCFRLGTGTSAKIAFVAATRHIEEQVPCLRFTSVKPKQTLDGCTVPAIEVRDENTGCWSAYKKDSGNKSASTITLLNLGRGCEMKGMVIHQLFKVLGIRKESSRIDRDKYVKINTEHLRQPWMKKFFAKREAPPPLEAYEKDPFDFLSINMYPAQAFTNGTGNSMEPLHDPFLAGFLGQRLGLSELDVEALGDLYGCPQRIAPSSRTRVLAELFLDGRGMHYDGTCIDDPEAATNLTLLLHEEYHSCAGISSHCADPRVAKTCSFSCLHCVPADAEVVAQRNLLVEKEGMRYCDDANCRTISEEGRACKVSNPQARRVPCNASQQIFDGDAANASTDCADVQNTGIKYKDGPEATCEDLRSSCSSKEMGAKVRSACPATCMVEGFPCAPKSNSSLWGANVSSEGCRDKEKHEPPILTLFGKAQDCSSARQYCFHHANSSQVQQKCPFSCGACVPKTGFRPEEEAASFEAAHESPPRTDGKANRTKTK